jgi:hypothetical protein
VARLAVALVWLYQGLWCKVLARCPGHRAIVESVPWLGEPVAAAALATLGLAEILLAAWVLSGWRPWWAAGVQTVLLLCMNGGGLLWGREHIADAGAMITQNIAFLTLAWLAAGRAARPAGEGSPWRPGRLDGREGPPQLLFGRMFEDWRIEEQALPPGGRVFCIASSGDTARALAARGNRVTAVDVNPVQVAYARERGTGAPACPGLVDRRMALGRRALRWLGLRERDLRAFLQLASPEEQVRFWRDHLDTRRFRTALRFALSPLVLRLTHGEAFVRFLPPRFDRIVRRRLERGWAAHPNRGNPYAWRLLLGCEPPEGREPAGASGSGSVELVCADAAEYLEGCPPGSFSGFSLSNILDAAPPAYRQRLTAAVRRAAAPGAVVVLRTFGEPRDAAAAGWAARDRSLLWGGIEVSRIEAGQG